jgi:hypothetical protein
VSRSLLPWLLVAPLLLSACPSSGDDDDDDDAACEGTFTWTFDGTPGEGAAGQTCGLSQGPTFITIGTSDGEGNDWQLTFSDFQGEGTWEIVPFGDWSVTGHQVDESWWAEAGSIVVETWADPSLIGSFDVTGANDSDDRTFAATGDFDVTVQEYVE